LQPHNYLERLHGELNEIHIAIFDRVSKSLARKNFTKWIENTRTACSRFQNFGDAVRHSPTPPPQERLRDETPLFFSDGVAGYANTQFLPYFLVYLAQHVGHVDLAAAQFRKVFQRLAAIVIVQTQHGQRHKHFVRMKTRILAIQNIYFRVLYGFYHLLRNEFHAMFYPREIFGRIEYQRRAGTEQLARLRRDDGSIGQFNGGGATGAGLLLAFLCGGRGSAVGY